MSLYYYDFKDTIELAAGHEKEFFSYGKFDWLHKDDEVFFNYVAKHSEDNFDCKTFNRVEYSSDVYFNFIKKLEFICRIGLYENQTMNKEKVHYDGRAFSLEDERDPYDLFSESLLMFMNDEQKYGLALYFCTNNKEYPDMPKLIDPLIEFNLDDEK